MTRPEYDTNAAGWVLPEYFSESPPTYTLADIQKMKDQIRERAKPYHYVINTEEETPMSTAQEEIQAAQASVRKHKAKAERAAARLVDAEKWLKAAQEAKAKAEMPKEPTARASLGTGHSIPPVVFFRKPVAGGFASYCAVRRGSSEWSVAGIVRLFTWAALLEFMGEEGRRTLAVTDASSWHRPERGA